MKDRGEVARPGVGISRWGERAQKHGVSSLELWRRPQRRSSLFESSGLTDDVYIVLEGRDPIFAAVKVASLPVETWHSSSANCSWRCLPSYRLGCCSRHQAELG